VKKNELLAEVQLGARKAGLDKIADREIDSEIVAYRRSKKTNKK
jgi:hypothetical protein